MGTLRFDLNALASAKAGKEDKQAALASRKEFLQAVGDRGAGPPTGCKGVRQGCVGGAGLTPERENTSAEHTCPP